MRSGEGASAWFGWVIRCVRTGTITDLLRSHFARVREKRLLFRIPCSARGVVGTEAPARSVSSVLYAVI